MKKLFISTLAKLGLAGAITAGAAAYWFWPSFRISGMLAIIGYWMLNMTDWKTLLVFGLVNFLSCFILSLGALFIEESAFSRYPKISDLNKMLFYSFLMFMGYRQVGVWWRLLGHIDFFRNNNSWGTMVRTNFNK